MSAILLCLLLVFSVAGWWLSHQGLTSKPWLECGPGTVGDHDRHLDVPPAKTGLFVLLAVVGALFALFTSGYFIRTEYSDWRTMPIPPVVWVNTGILVIASISIQGALISARKGEFRNCKFWLANTCVATLAFLVGQLLAWQQLADSGYVLTANPANSFFYMITAVHGFHILGGMVALGRAIWLARHEAPLEKLRSSLELCAPYWHFLLIVWVFMLVVLIGWANEFLDICGRLLH